MLQKQTSCARETQVPSRSSMTRRRRLGVEVADGQQLACAHLDARPAPAQGLETVRDAEDGGRLELFLQNLLKQYFRFLVQGGSGLVEGKKSRLLEKHARQANLSASQRQQLYGKRAGAAAGVTQMSGENAPVASLRD